ncbi:hypothetical protein F2Q70_00011764 [Brassica cretica]|uniref:Uncharacterized protein n=1 Tax=Brassica cretica TaxID=69181 RepID=A0A3N6QCA5_BRACR|nr:hypothetical protein F2Q70_00011764 [Brassica cretica]KAF3551714.1 hypothetical protein DY000_02007230 [Brassica cretica]
MLIHFRKSNDTKIETWITKTAILAAAKTWPGKQRSPGRINILAIRSGKTDTKREGQMSKKNGEEANPKLREN